MTRYRIVCIIQHPIFLPTTHAHIFEVGAVPEGDDRPVRLSLPDILEAMKAGDRFYAVGEQSHQRASVEAASCPNCGRLILRTVGDAVKDNNVDCLQRCYPDPQAASITLVRQAEPMH
ncbi:MAG: hypothetical protein HZB53_06470 [Chloroflexi bacterium]|nr:hypothetical protein [Chloroflexota bacterium]